MSEGLPAEKPVLLFDGHCNLCSGIVKFILENERGEEIRFAPLDSEAGEQIKEELGIEDRDKESLIFVEGEKYYERSEGTAKLFEKLQPPYPLLAKIISILPDFLTDLGYRMVAKYRYRIFGRKDSCMVPTGDLKERFLDEG